MTLPADYDLLIVGGGLIGSSLALALASQPLRIGIIEAVPPNTQEQPSFDSRAIALAFGSRRIFEGIGCWSAIAPDTTPIRHIHVSDRGHFGVTRLDASQASLPALGYVVEVRILGQIVYQRLQDFPQIELICPAKVVNIASEATKTHVQIASHDHIRTLSTRLLVAADGGHSLVRQLLQIPTQKRDYGQTAIIANVATERPHQYRAFERFTDTGPLALLPLDEKRCNLVWTVKNIQAPYLTAVDKETFLARLQQRFGQRLGRFTRIGKRHAYPLQLLRAQQQVAPRTVLIGNAAHNLHPVAGQGFNLGLRDVAVLAQTLADAQKAGHDLGAPETLSIYAQWRQGDQHLVTGLTDTLVRLFSNDYPLLGPARGLGLAALDLFPPLKQQFMRQTMGLAGRQSRLARGLAL
ncbi:2-octaprenyl-6-methoxyphenyl hydroxylase [Nitrosococcus wardiae]|uniref:2-octaprenyl-6-methoxyphenyl hydroxylase n=1 Tax=Nitrosococcus wardiae TaxID=1814290 RepID=A0A4P7BWJ2_9GAMM|nr:2-octaprenyl-6-methoxyphenyl hydroxylase [Nitrosococcus wardiae]QBQ53589.1 2-octaprenyl-6-methoxyphenyl hydroxylase [Nitrosococcus wardiae]